MNGENIRSVVALVLLVILFFSTVWLLSKEGGKEENAEERKNNRIRSIAYDAFIIALIVIMTFVPNIGFLNLGPFSLTLLHLPVLFGASLFGWKRGAIYGLAFGIMSWIKALMGATNILDLAFQKIYVAVPPRLLFGLIAGILFSAARKIQSDKGRNYAFMGVAFVSTCLHTAMVFLVLGLSEDWVYAWLTSSEPAVQGWAITVSAFLALGMGMEALLGAFLTPTLNGIVRRSVPGLKLKHS